MENIQRQCKSFSINFCSNTFVFFFVSIYLGLISRSIALKLVRHAESRNNEVYRKARILFKGGTADFDFDGWNNYVDKHRAADPGISDKGQEQARRLAQFLAPHLINQASKPVQIISSPMRRTLETAMPTLSALHQSKSDVDDESPFSVIVNAFYFESEGCHLRDVPGKTLYRSLL